MARVFIIEERETVAELILAQLRQSPAVEMCLRAPQQDDGYAGHLSGGYAGLLAEHRIDTVVYAPAQHARNSLTPDLESAEFILRQCARASLKRFVLMSSAMIYGASPHNQGFIQESRMMLRNDKQKVAGAWAALERLAFAHMGELSHTGIELIIMRPAAVLVPGGADYFSRLFRSPFAITLPGHDPTMQLLSPLDLAQAVRAILEQSGGAAAGDVYNIAPGGVLTLRAALRLAGSKRVPVPRFLQRLARAVLRPTGLAHSLEQLDYIRYSWTISDKKSRVELARPPRRSSAEALAELCETKSSERRPYVSAAALSGFDDFGMDKNYIAAYGRTLFRFLHDYYWRVEFRGLEHVPPMGRGVLVGCHRGFMPWDGVMALHLMVRELGRYPRFLIHPGLVKFPFLFNYMTKLGGIIACQENAEYVLTRDEIVGIFPEGIRGAFTLYRDAYRLGKFGRDEFVKMALRYQAPIIPFVTVGSAETFPILKKLDWNWWKRHTEWPAFPLTPTFPFLPPVPLPAKWHTQFLAPIHVEQRYPPEAAGDIALVRALSREVRTRMQEAIDEMLRRRKSIFYGSVFEADRGCEEGAGRGTGYEKKIGYEETLG
jgi:1-acyl-sn-glycerol-3-phosphate acyltransferase/nucleoside-diphosphate-sugar epimerase